MDRTLVICKPDAVERGLVGEIISRFERRGLTIAAMELRQVDEETAGKHYEEHADKPFYGELIEFITRGPAVVLVVEGPEDTWKVVRTMMGTTNPATPHRAPSGATWASSSPRTSSTARTPPTRPSVRSPSGSPASADPSRRRGGPVRPVADGPVAGPLAVRPSVAPAPSPLPSSPRDGGGIAVVLRRP
jgi:nucleoside-diphosphate kinase